MKAIPNYVLSLPFVMVYVIGIVLSVVRWQRHPMASALALSGFSIIPNGNAFSGVTKIAPLATHGGR